MNTLAKMMGAMVRHFRMINNLNSNLRDDTVESKGGRSTESSGNNLS